MIAAGALVVVYLREPREKYWGRLDELGPVGASLRGMEISLVEEWARELGRGDERTMGPSTVFFPLWRIEKIFLDEDVGAARSTRAGFLEIVGREVEEYL